MFLLGWRCSQNLSPLPVQNARYKTQDTRFSGSNFKFQATKLRLPCTRTSTQTTSSLTLYKILKEHGGRAKLRPQAQKSRSQANQEFLFKTTSDVSLLHIKRAGCLSRGYVQQISHSFHRSPNTDFSLGITFPPSSTIVQLLLAFFGLSIPYFKADSCVNQAPQQDLATIKSGAHALPHSSRLKSRRRSLSKPETPKTCTQEPFSVLKDLRIFQRFLKTLKLAPQDGQVLGQDQEDPDLSSFGSSQPS
ncbi:hypothetical protein B0H13DRAFT_1880215 [Mycena leptocephala]|nr:hypothetical protein B0H13DRAFT_1880215 [Mycena leptocephala]